jgi:DNA-directed RNA polymerase specialized sigma subunit
LDQKQQGEVFVTKDFQIIIFYHLEKINYVIETVRNLPSKELAEIYLKYLDILCEDVISNQLCLSTSKVSIYLKSAIERLRADLIPQQRESVCA